MIRIVGVERSEFAAQEFILLQNQGSMRQTLRGHVLMAASALQTGIGSQYVFTDETSVGAGQFIMLRSGMGQSGWKQTKDGSVMYCVYAGASQPLWQTCGESIHVLHVQHSFATRSKTLLGVR